MICCENVVKILWTQHFFLNSSPDFSNHYFILFFFLPFSAMSLPQLLNFFLFPYFGNGIATIRFSQFFFLPIFDNVIATIVTKKKIFPLFRQWHCHNQFVNFFFSFHFGHSMHTGSRIGHRKFGIPVAEIQHFLSPPFSSSLSYFWLNFSNGNTKIQSFSSKSQISLNSSYNAN